MFFMWPNVQFTRKFITSWTYSSWWQTIPLSVSYYFAITSNDLDSKWPQMISDDPKWPHYFRFCNKAFIQRTDVLAHERVHTGEKPFGKSNFWPPLYMPSITTVMEFVIFRTELVIGNFSMPILWKTFPTSFNNERTWKEFLSSSSRLWRKSKIKRRRTRRIKFWRTFASFSLTATKFNTRSCKYPQFNFQRLPVRVPTVCTQFWPFWLIMILGGWIVGNFWTDNLKSKRFDGIKFWKFDKFIEWIEFIIENDFTGTSIVTIKSCREKNNRCIWLFRQSSNCKLKNCSEVHSK